MSGGGYGELRIEIRRRRMKGGGLQTFSEKHADLGQNVPRASITKSKSEQDSGN